MACSGPRKHFVVRATDSAGEVAAVEWSSDGRRWHPMKRQLREPDQWSMETPMPAYQQGEVELWFRAVDDSLNIGKEYRWKEKSEL